MTHELKKIIEAYEIASSKHIRCVLATVVALDGSSYRRPGVRMLICENGKMIGAVSGGCVEKEVLLQANSVFANKVSKVMTYDGRYRLGCEGILYILLEYFEPSKEFLKSFWNSIKSRKSISVDSYYKEAYGENPFFGSVFTFQGQVHPVNEGFQTDGTLLLFSQDLVPCFQVVIIGAEHDAVQLCSFAALTGWQVTLVVDPKEEKSINDFPGATEFIPSSPETIQLELDKQTAVVLMTHSYVKDLQYLMALKDEQPAYFGLLGPVKRREKLFDELLERCPKTPNTFLDSIHGPAGIDLGAETPQEIAISVLAEVLSITNKANPISLRDKKGRIHIT